MWKPQPLVALPKVLHGLYRDNFTFTVPCFTYVLYNIFAKKMSEKIFMYSTAEATVL
jgi:hypothetical protein